MKWLEVISVRNASNGRDVHSELDLTKALKRSEAEIGLRRIQLFRHATLKRDISIHLIFENDNLKEEKSELGLQLTALFEQFGLVNHTLWVLEDDLQ